MHGPEIRHLRYFVAVAEELSFSKAAVRLHMSQPPLSQQIKALEDDLGVQLLERSRREVRLTEAGKIFLNESRTILASLRSAVGATIRAAEADGGNVKIGFVTSALLDVLPSLLARMSKSFPEIELSVYDMSSRDQVEALMQERLDIGIVHSIPAIAAFNKLPIYSEPFILAIPEGHELEKEEKITAADLEKYRIIGFSREHSPSLYDAQLACCLAKGFRPTLVHQARTPFTVFQLIRSGLGISIVPKPYARLPFPGIVFKDVDNSAGHLHLYAVWRDEISSELIKKVIRQVMYEPFVERG
ncbi:LysR substrate-binding domain-containing protein [Bordetella tumulicola]|uniref:LysR substrate-binding domain-containing protein n=1 Tax=Bordetella tumulicola TaxID=1649133 RepID=UPI0039EEC57D